MTITGTRGDKGIWMREHTLWKKTEMAVFAYFSKFHNKNLQLTEILQGLMLVQVIPITRKLVKI